MAKDKDKKRTKWDERTDARSAEYIVRRLDTIEEDLGDLLAEFRAFGRYDHISYTSLCIRLMADVRKKYKKIAEGHTWEEED